MPFTASPKSRFRCSAQHFFPMIFMKSMHLTAIALMGVVLCGVLSAQAQTEPPLNELFTIQVASFSKKSNALGAFHKLRQHLGAEAVQVRVEMLTPYFTLRVGAAQSKEALLGLLEKVREDNPAAIVLQAHIDPKRVLIGVDAAGAVQRHEIDAVDAAAPNTSREAHELVEAAPAAMESADEASSKETSAPIESAAPAIQPTVQDALQEVEHGIEVKLAEQPGSEAPQAPVVAESSPSEPLASKNQGAVELAPTSSNGSPEGRIINSGQALAGTAPTHEPEAEPDNPDMPQTSPHGNGSTIVGYSLSGKPLQLTTDKSIATPEKPAEEAQQPVEAEQAAEVKQAVAPELKEAAPQHEAEPLPSLSETIPQPVGQKMAEIGDTPTPLAKFLKPYGIDGEMAVFIVICAAILLILMLSVILRLFKTTEKAEPLRKQTRQNLGQKIRNKFQKEKPLTLADLLLNSNLSNEEQDTPALPESPQEPSPEPLLSSQEQPSKPAPLDTEEPGIKPDVFQEPSPLPVQEAAPEAPVPALPPDDYLQTLNQDGINPLAIGLTSEDDQYRTSGSQNSELARQIASGELAMPKLEDSKGRFLKSNPAELEVIMRNILDLSVDQGLTSIYVTSCSSGEGKTRLSMSLAHSLANEGYRTLLVDANSVAPVLYTMYNTSYSPGLLEALNGGVVNIHDLVRPTHYENLHLMTLGAKPATNGDEYETFPLNLLLQALSQDFEFVILDGQSLSEPFSLLVASTCDGTVVVAPWKKPKWPSIKKNAQEIVLYGGNVIGVVQNKRPVYVPSFVFRKPYQETYVEVEFPDAVMENEHLTLTGADGGKNQRSALSN